MRESFFTEEVARPRGKSMVSLVNSDTNATRIGWCMWEIDLIFAPSCLQGEVVHNIFLYIPACHLPTACRLASFGTIGTVGLDTEHTDIRRCP